MGTIIIQSTFLKKKQVQNPEKHLSNFPSVFLPRAEKRKGGAAEGKGEGRHHRLQVLYHQEATDAAKLRGNEDLMVEESSGRILATAS